MCGGPSHRVPRTCVTEGDGTEKAVPSGRARAKVAPWSVLREGTDGQSRAVRRQHTGVRRRVHGGADGSGADVTDRGPGRGRVLLTGGEPAGAGAGGRAGGGGAGGGHQRR